MISMQELRRCPAFAPLNPEQMEKLMATAKTISVAQGEYLFHEGEILTHFYLVLEGTFEILIQTPKLDIEYDTHGQPGRLEDEMVLIAKVEPGEIMGWSGLVPPHKATSGSRALTPSQVAAFDCKKLLHHFETDCRFGYYMLQTAAQVIGKRLQNMHTGGGK